jgi:hypothetical protein
LKEEKDSGVLRIRLLGLSDQIDKMLAAGGANLFGVDSVVEGYNRLLRDAKASFSTKTRIGELSEVEPTGVKGNIGRMAMELPLLQQTAQTVKTRISELLAILTQSQTENEDDSSKLSPYVFVSHSSKDSLVISATKQAFNGLRVAPHFVEEAPAGGPPSREIARLVKGARALFAYFTYNSTYDRETRDWIVFEIGVAVAHGRRIFAWKEKQWPKEQLPRLLEQVTTYRDMMFDPQGVIDLARDIRKAASEFDA